MYCTVFQRLLQHSHLSTWNFCLLLYNKSSQAHAALFSQIKKVQVSLPIRVLSFSVEVLQSCRASLRSLLQVTSEMWSLQWLARWGAWQASVFSPNSGQSDWLSLPVSAVTAGHYRYHGSSPTLSPTSPWSFFITFQKFIIMNQSLCP